MFPTAMAATATSETEVLDNMASERNFSNRLIIVAPESIGNPLVGNKKTKATEYVGIPGFLDGGDFQHIESDSCGEGIAVGEQACSYAVSAVCRRYGNSLHIEDRMAIYALGDTNNCLSGANSHDS